MDSPRSSLRLAVSAMATRFELVIVDDGRGEVALRAIGEAALATIVECDAALSRFRSDGLVALIEREASSRPVRLDDATFALFAESLAVQVASEGRFDIAVGDAMERWGFHEAAAPSAAAEPRLAPAGAERARDGRPPAPAFTLDAVARTIRLARPDARIDLGGIAKGHAIDLAASVLREHGVSDALLHGGTSAIAALGAPPGDGGWAVAIAGLGGPDTMRVVLRNEAMCVSAARGRVVDGRAHIIDPGTGRPAQTASLAAVIGSSARTCDAWTKPALLEGRSPTGLPRGYRCVVEPSGGG